MRLWSRAQGALQGVSVAVDSLRAAPSRAALTVGAVAVAVFAVVVAAAAGRGIDAAIVRDLAAAPSATLHVFRWPIAREPCLTGARCASRAGAPLTGDDARALARLPTIRAAAAHRGSRVIARGGGATVRDVALDAESPGWLSVAGGDVYPGRSFTAQEDSAASPAVVVNEALAERVFGVAAPVGRVVELNGVPFRVIGVYHRARSAGADGGRRAPDPPRAVVPMEAARALLGVPLRWTDLAVSPRDGVSPAAAADAVRLELHGMRGIRAGASDDFVVVTRDRLVALHDDLAAASRVVLIAVIVAGVLAGCAGVVALMMISVAERTREIGMRKALGATRGTIVGQLLLEAATLSCIGAVLGLVAGGALTLLIQNATPVPADIPPMGIAAALAAAALCGLASGAVPALRAARLRPADALRRA